MIQYSKEQLDAMSIWQLRDYARKLGHKSPAARKKGELVEYISSRYQEIDKSGGKIEEIKPAATGKRPRGRPPKTILADYNIVEQPVKNLKIADGAAAEIKSYADPAPKHYEPAPKPYDAVKPYSSEPVEREERKQDKKEFVTRDFRKDYDKFERGGRDFGNRDFGNREFNNNRRDEYRGGEGYQKEEVPFNPQSEDVEIREGVLEICPDGYGFLRAHNYEQGDGDAYIAAPRIRKSGLRKGDYVVGYVKKMAENRPWNVQDIISINDQPPAKALIRPSFDNLIPIYPDKRFKLEINAVKNDFAIRAIDLVAPIGKGQRGMIVSPPKAGKTTLLKKIAHSIATNYPQAHLIVLLIDERPEEVTDMQRSIQGEVVFSTFDETPEHHTKAAEMVLERAKRLTEMGKDVIILMDSLTRLARAYNLVITPTGKTLSGGIDPGALHNPKRFFGAARNIENGGSLTIIATALIDTGSRMDDVIYEEFKGTGNMEIHLDRKLSEKRIFPAIDLNRSGTRREELLLDQKELEGIWAVRKMLSAGDVQEATENLIAMMVKTASNKEFIEQLNLQLLKLQKEGYMMR
jgi:transcription termination factor Rho